MLFIWLEYMFHHGAVWLFFSIMYTGESMNSVQLYSMVNVMEVMLLGRQ